MPESIDLVLLDLTLSSGYAEVEAMQRFGQNSAAGFMQKPYRGTRLRQAGDAVRGKSAAP